MNKVKHIALCGIVILCTVYALIFPYEISFHCKNALSLCALSVLPSLFIYIFLSQIISSSMTFSGKTSSCLSRFFALSPHLLPAAFFGLISGAPGGAVMCKNIYEKGLCTKDEAERCAAISNNCSAAFILSIVSANTGYREYALLLYISSLLASVTVYLLVQKNNDYFTKTSNSFYEKREPPSRIFSNAIKKSATSSIELCSYVTVFYVISNVLCERLSSIFPVLFQRNTRLSFIIPMIKGFFEVTSGVISAGSLTIGTERLIIISGICSFCGLSIILQTADVLHSCGLSAKKFILQKVLCAFVCPFFMLLLLLVLPTSVMTISTNSKGGFGVHELISIAAVTVFAVLGAKILSLIDKRHKNNR